MSMAVRKKVGNYTIHLDEMLGVGTFSKVFRGIQFNQNPQCSQIKREVAVKIVQKATMSEDIYAEVCLLQETRLMKKIKSTNVVSCFDILQTKNNFYMIFELVQGINLRTYLRLNGRLAERAVLKILIQILNGFGELLKQKIVHRDLKPENILIKDGILKVTGFHFSKKLSLHNPCVSIVGTPAYMAPQILQQQEYTNKCDIWSLGVIVYEMVVGTVPWTFSQHTFEGDKRQITIREIVFPPQVEMSSNMKSFILGCLCRDQDKRYTWEQVFCDPLFKDIFRLNFTSKGQSDE